MYLLFHAGSAFFFFLRRGCKVVIVLSSKLIRERVLTFLVNMWFELLVFRPPRFLSLKCQSPKSALVWTLHHCSRLSEWVGDYSCCHKARCKARFHFCITVSSSLLSHTLKFLIPLSFFQHFFFCYLCWSTTRCFVSLSFIYFLVFLRFLNACPQSFCVRVPALLCDLPG